MILGILQNLCLFHQWIGRSQESLQGTQEVSPTSVQFLCSFWCWSGVPWSLSQTLANSTCVVQGTQEVSPTSVQFLCSFWCWSGVPWSLSQTLANSTCVGSCAKKVKYFQNMICLPPQHFCISVNMSISMFCFFHFLKLTINSYRTLAL